jgi:hypothetical protein
MFRSVACLVFASCATQSSPLSDVAPCEPDPAFDPGTWQGSAVDVPMEITQVFSDGGMRFSINIEVGDAPLQVWLDTGSTGLRILRDAVPDEAIACATTTPVTYAYESGLELTGVVARASVGIGDVVTPAPIPVMYIDGVDCASNKPDCPASGNSASDAAVFNGFDAIMGVGLRDGGAGIGSPIAQLPGQPSFVVSAPSYGEGDGTLTIGPVDTSMFTTLQLPGASDDGTLANGTPAWDDRFGIPACIDDMTSGIDYCEPGVWDTGAAQAIIEWPAAGSDSVLGPDSQIAVTVGPADAPLAAYAFTVGAVPVAGVDEIYLAPAVGEGFINLGTALFFHADALFDPLHGIVGLHAR